MKTCFDTVRLTDNEVQTLIVLIENALYFINSINVNYKLSYISPVEYISKDCKNSKDIKKIEI